MKMMRRRDKYLEFILTSSRSCHAIQNQRVANLTSKSLGSFQLVSWFFWVALMLLGDKWERFLHERDERASAILRMRMPRKVLAENCCNLRDVSSRIAAVVGMIIQWLENRKQFGKQNLCQFSSRCTVMGSAQARRESV